jgi:hypothetical protein
MSTTQNAVLAVAYVSLTAPAGSVVDHVTITATALTPANSPPNQSVPPGTTAVTFSNLTPDTYTFTAQAFPASGPGFGTAVSTTLVVTGTTVILQIPGTLSATQP